MLNELRVGNRIWSQDGYADHGPMEGPKVTIPPEIGGLIVAREERYGSPLYAVKWDNGQTSKHYGGRLFIIGQYATASDFRQAIKTASGTAERTLGPAGGFREGRADLVLQDGSAVQLEFFRSEGRVWDYLFAGSAIAVTTNTPEPKAPARPWGDGPSPWAGPAETAESVRAHQLALLGVEPDAA